MQVAIVTFQFEGLTRNAGIGTAYRRLAELLANGGYHVTVVYLPLQKDEPAFIDSREAEKLKRMGISLVTLRTEHRVRRSHGLFGYHLGRSLQIYRFLSSRNFDVVHASDNYGLLYVSLLAKKEKKEFQNCSFVIGAHGPRPWTLGLNGGLTSVDARIADLDRGSVKMTDYLVSPSRYMIRYLKANDWRLPESTFVIPNVNRLKSTSVASRERAKSRIRSHGRQIVFFGRLETRKGMFLFLDAILRLLESSRSLGRRQPLELIFLGKDYDDALGSIRLIRERLAPFRKRLKLRFISHMSSRQCTEFLSRHRGQLVCMPSLAENSPYVVVEAIELGLNFLTTSSGGQIELIHPADRHRVLCRAEAESLMESLRARLVSAPAKVRPSLQTVRANDEWRRFHSRLCPANR